MNWNIDLIRFWIDISTASTSPSSCSGWDGYQCNTCASRGEGQINSTTESVQTGHFHNSQPTFANAQLLIIIFLCSRQVQERLIRLDCMWIVSRGGHDDLSEAANLIAIKCVNWNPFTHNSKINSCHPQLYLSVGYLALSTRRTPVLITQRPIQWPCDWRNYNQHWIRLLRGRSNL